jgi:hypothetical protein
MRSPRVVLADIGKGAGLGLALGLVLLSVGLLRAAVYLLTGGKLQPLAAADSRMMAVYVGAFAAAGALLGATRPLLRTKAGVYTACMAAGVIVVLALARFDRRHAAMHAGDWWFVGGLGAILGAAGAYGWFRAGD